MVGGFAAAGRVRSTSPFRVEEASGSLPKAPLQLLKAPLFRSIDLALATCDLFTATLPNLRFRPERVALTPRLHAAEVAHRLVVDEGIPFREAYRRVAARLRSC